MRHVRTETVLGPIFVLLLTAVGATGCGEDDSTDTRSPDELDAFWDTLRSDAVDYQYEDGYWHDDYGDGAFYGMAFYARAGEQLNDEAYRARAREIRDYNVTTVEHANANVLWYMDNLEEVLMSALGLVEYADATADTAFLSSLDAYIDQSNSIVAGFGNYIEVDLGEYAAATYGPTAITGGLALLNLQYATYIDTDRRQSRIDAAVEIVEAIDAKAFDGDRYLFEPGEEKLFLYPNSIMLLVLCRLHELTGEQAYLDQAERVFQGVEPLRDTELGYYRSPYSAEYMGAQTDDYSTLSSQNYFTLALLLLYQNTGDALYLDRARQILDWLRLTLYDGEQGRILHHWIDGHIAPPRRPRVFLLGLQPPVPLRRLVSEVGGWRLILFCLRKSRQLLSSARNVWQPTTD